jgi:(1->4)-alpha-D-glucan 1-alpha-D-glucosylmutase
MDVPPDAAEQIEKAISKARKRSGHLDTANFDFVRDVLLLLNLPHVPAEQREARLGFVMRWQQVTGPIVAKGLEDTSLYVFHPLLSLNEVGGDPTPSKATSGQEFNSFLENRIKQWPSTLNATSTHDTKRSEDVRARINVLSEMPEDWKLHLDRWAQHNAAHKIEVGGQAVPDRNEEYFLYQTLLGVWSFEQGGPTALLINDPVKNDLLERVQAHLVKATREAMVHTRWTRPNQEHEAALQKFVAAILSPDESSEFLQDFTQFQKKIAHFGMINGLSQTLLKITAPGVPDFYQGSELWDLRLVDPDNRGPVDFAARKAILQQIASSDSSDAPALARLQDLVRTWQDGRIKLYLTWKALQFRREHEALFREGAFLPLPSEGTHSRNVSAFLRRRGKEWALIAIPKWLSTQGTVAQGALKGIDWQDTRIVLPPDAPARWSNVLAPQGAPSLAEEGEKSVLADSLFREFPVALFKA